MQVTRDFLCFNCLKIAFVMNALVHITLIKILSIYEAIFGILLNRKSGWIAIIMLSHLALRTIPIKSL